MGDGISSTRKLSMEQPRADLWFKYLYSRPHSKIIANWLCAFSIRNGETTHEEIHFEGMSYLSSCTVCFTGLIWCAEGGVKASSSPGCLGWLFQHGLFEPIDIGPRINELYSTHSLNSRHFPPQNTITCLHS